MRHTSILIAGLLACASQPSLAAVITSLPGGTAVTIAAANAYGVQSGALSGGVTWSSTSANTVLGWTYGYGFALNGNWSGTPMIGLNADTGTMTFNFAAPVRTILADINWENYNPNVTMSIFGTTGNLLETAALSTLFAPGSLGFGRDDADIGSFTLSNGYAGLRNLSFAGNPILEQTLTALNAVPEPATWALMIGGFGLVGAAMRRRARRPANVIA